MIPQQAKLSLRVRADVPGQHRLHDARDLIDSLKDLRDTGKHEAVPHQPGMQLPHRIDQNGLIRAFVIRPERHAVRREQIAHDLLIRAAISTRLNLRSTASHHLESASVNSLAHPAVLDQRVINIPQQQHLLTSSTHNHPLPGRDLRIRGPRSAQLTTPARALRASQCGRICRERQRRGPPGRRARDAQAEAASTCQLASTAASTALRCRI